MKIRLMDESSAIRRAKEFLRRQKHSLKIRQDALNDAKHEYRTDIRTQQVTGSSPHAASLLEDVRLGLERVSKITNQ